MVTTEDNMRSAALLLGFRASDLDYLIHFDPTRRVAYFETPKVACTAIKKFMQDTVSGRCLNYEDRSQVHNRAVSPIRPLSERSAQEILAVFWGNVQRFSFVRNPYTRILSGYLDKIVKNEWERNFHLPNLGFDRHYKPSFLEFLEALKLQSESSRDIHFTTQVRLLATGNVEYNFIGRFECFDTDFLELKRVFFGDSSFENYASFGKHHASGAGEKLSQYFGWKERELVCEMFLPDFLVFGYSMDLEAASEPPTKIPEAMKCSLASTLARLRFSNLSSGSRDSLFTQVESAMTEGRISPVEAAVLLIRAST